MNGNIKSGLIGGVAAVALTSAATALAGTGIGGIFNLGQSNSVDAKTTLTGNTNDAQLEINNTSTGAGAAGLKITVPAGKPPLSVSTSIKATNLNADAVDSLSANQIGTRVAYKDSKNITWFENGRSTLQSVSLTAPQNGFVSLSGGATAGYTFGCSYCAAHIRFQIDGSTETSTAASIVNSTATEQYLPLSHQVTVPVVKGTHTYALVGSWYDVNGTGVVPDWDDPSLNAQFIPYNGVGTLAVPAAAPARAPAKAGGSKVMR